MLHDDETAGETFELYGPKNYSMAEIANLVDKEIIKHRRHLNLPKSILKPIANILNKAIYWPTMSPDEVEREFIDQMVDSKAKTFSDLGIEPGEISNFMFHYLVRYPVPGISINGTNLDTLIQQAYRSAAFYDLPPQTEREKREEKKYLHVIDDQ